MSITPDQIQRPEVVAELRALFDDYEAALMANDVQALNDFFWCSPQVTRSNACFCMPGACSSTTR